MEQLELITLDFKANAPPLHTDADGVVRVGGTRVTLYSVVKMRRCLVVMRTFC